MQPQDFDQNASNHTSKTRFVSPAAAVLLLCASLLSGTAGAAEDERAQMSAETRQGLLKVVGMYLGPIVGMARKQIPYDADTVAHNASKIAQLAPMIPDVFRYDTRGSGVETEALDGIWDNTADFESKAATVAERASALAAATAQGEGAAMKAFGQVGAACKACHDEYRQQD